MLSRWLIKEAREEQDSARSQEVATCNMQHARRVSNKLVAKRAQRLSKILWAARHLDCATYNVEYVSQMEEDKDEDDSFGCQDLGLWGKVRRKTRMTSATRKTHVQHV
eukprot:g28644.t1